MTRISRTFRFESAHRLPHVPTGHKCSRLHGHSYLCTVTVEGEPDPHFGWIVDFAELDAAWKPLHEALDHRYLNEVGGLENPTSELLARFVFDRYRLAHGRLVSVAISETCTSEAVYTEGA